MPKKSLKMLKKSLKMNGIVGLLSLPIALTEKFWKRRCIDGIKSSTKGAAGLPKCLIFDDFTIGTYVINKGAADGPKYSKSCSTILTLTKRLNVPGILEKWNFESRSGEKKSKFQFFFLEAAQRRWRQSAATTRTRAVRAVWLTRLANKVMKWKRTQLSLRRQTKRRRSGWTRKIGTMCTAAAPAALTRQPKRSGSSSTS